MTIIPLDQRSDDSRQKIDTLRWAIRGSVYIWCVQIMPYDPYWLSGIDSAQLISDTRLPGVNIE